MDWGPAKTMWTKLKPKIIQNNFLIIREDLNGDYDMIKF